MSQFKPGDQIWDSLGCHLLGYVAQDGGVYEQLSGKKIASIDPRTGAIFDSLGCTLLGHIDRDNGLVMDALRSEVKAKAEPSGNIFDSYGATLLGKSIPGNTPDMPPPEPIPLAPRPPQSTQSSDSSCGAGRLAKFNIENTPEDWLDLD